jgi:hypothetical protein
MTRNAKLKNGLTATIQPIDCPDAQALVTILQKRLPWGLPPSHQFNLLSININGEKVHFIIPWLNRRHPVKLLSSMLATNPKRVLEAAPVIVYNESCYTYNDDAARIICAAILKKQNLHIYALLHA